MGEPILSQTIIIILQGSILIQTFWEIENKTLPPLWVLLTRLVATAAPLLTIFK